MIVVTEKQLMLYVFSQSMIPSNYFLLQDGKLKPVFFPDASLTGFLPGIRCKHDPVSTVHRPNVGSMLGQRRRRWANIEPTLDRCIRLTALWAMVV